jgi:Fe2+ or Zn2+ uptake regulation protein
MPTPIVNPSSPADRRDLVWNGSRLGVVDQGVSEWHETEDDIRATGLRCTTQRVAVLDVLRGTGGHQPVATIVDGVRHRLGRVSSQSVYDALEVLSSHGLVQRIEPAGSPALFEAADEPHRHAVCRRCGAVGDVELRHEPPGDLALRSAHGWDLDEVEITFWGLCPTCAASRRPDPT